ncbi:MAG: acyltransferase family protein [Polyangiaceae bacterium]|nr:acyltransferase family protein [Polyangiaceae bacterium]
MTELQTVGRGHAFDGVRAFAMLLGVFLHGSIPYIQVSFPWAVTDGSRSEVLTLVVYVVHTFRMPAFFLIAGYFARLLYNRLGTWGFLLHRVRRVLLPLFVGWLVVFPLVRVMWVWGLSSALSGVAFLPLLRMAFSPQFATYGFGLLHLWFLYYLLLIYLCALVARWALFGSSEGGNRRRAWVDRVFRRTVGTRFGILVVAIPTAFILVFMRGWGVDFVDRGFVPSLAHIIFYGIFFTFGWAMHRNVECLGELSRRWVWNLGVGLVMLIPAMLALLKIYLIGGPVGLGFRVSYFLVYAIVSWSLVFALLGAFQRYLCAPSKVWRYLSDASYWVYLVHLPIVIAISILLRGWECWWGLKLLVVLTGAMALLLGSYHVMVRNTWVGVMLNGRRASSRTHG